MKRSTGWLVLASVMFVSGFVSCGAVPKEVSYLVRQYALACDLFFKDGCLTETQRKELMIGVYMGSNAAECKSIYDETYADRVARSAFTGRYLDEVEGNKCLESVSKLTCDDVKKIVANMASDAVYGDAALAKVARTTLGYPDGYRCTTDMGVCLAEPACNLALPTSLCAPYKVFPRRDATLRANENANALQPAAANVGCGFGPFPSANN